MIIGFDASRAFIKDRTGTENYSFQLLKALAKIDTEDIVKVYIRPGQELGVKSQDWPENFQFKMINFPWLWTQVGLALQTFTDPLDVLFIPAHTLPLIRNPFLKTVITVHDLGAEYLPAFHQLKQVLYLKLMTYYQLRSASKIIAVSEATKKDIIKKVGVESAKIEVVYEAVDESAFSHLPAGKAGQLSAISQAASSNILRRYDIEENKYFLFVGTIHPRKNLKRLIAAFARFVRGPAAPASHRPSSLDSSLRARRQEPSSASPLTGSMNEFKLVLVGGKGWKSDDIYSLPKELGIEKNVCFLGRISDQDLVALYSNAAALTYPSLFEGFGLPILEAFACGCAVITSNTSSMPEIAGNAALLVDAGNETEIAEAMVKITKNDAFRNSLVVKGYSRLKNFSWDAAAQNTLKILRSVRERKGNEN